MSNRDGLLETRNLTIAFGGLIAVKKVNFKIYQEEILSLIGPNGAGKTTFLNLLTGFLKPQGGSIIYEGSNIESLSPFAITYRRILRTFQHTALFLNLTVYQNVLTGFHSKTKSGLLGSFFNSASFRKEEQDCKKKALDILIMLEMEKQAEVLAKNLPFGNQRKLGIAIALAGDPKLLLLDEPAAGMNPDESMRLMDLIKELKRWGITVLLVEHDMKVVMGISDRVFVLNHGEKIAEGTPTEIAHNEDVIRVYLGRSTFLDPKTN